LNDLNGHVHIGNCNFYTIQTALYSSLTAAEKGLNQRLICYDLQCVHPRVKGIG